MTIADRKRRLYNEATARGARIVNVELSQQSLAFLDSLGITRRGKKSRAAAVAAIVAAAANGGFTLNMEAPPPTTP